jgi:ribulose-5-phosphate 4-epimerase/fuculose-1-phosphate aldolase
MKAVASFAPTKWDEKTYEHVSARMKMTKASIAFAYTGQIEGKASVEYLMFYVDFDEKDPHKATANYVGLILFQGKLNGKSGSFAMEDHGAFKADTARSVLTIIPGSGTGELEGITGRGNSVATPEKCDCELDYDV